MEKYEKNGKNVYYKDFGAKGDGVTDDFLAIIACHDYANSHGCTVNSDEGSPVYYIGDSAIASRRYAKIKTDTNWNGAKFIFDDSKIPVEYKYLKHIYNGEEVTYKSDAVKCDENAQCARCLKKIHEDRGGCTRLYDDDAWHRLPIFKIDYDEGEYIPLTETFKGVKIKKGDTHITLPDGNIWKPSVDMLVRIKTTDTRKYIRWGVNQDNGAPQTEVLLVHRDGSVDESTPVQWTYDNITSAAAKSAESEPVTVSGGERGCIITTIANRGPNYYYAYGRNIVINRSNTTLKGVYHYIEGEGLSDENGRLYGKCPTEFTSTNFVHNVTFDDMVFTHQKNHYDASSKALLGTYEVAATESNKITYRGIKTSNFFLPDGTIIPRGYMGTNHCRNFLIEDSQFLSFDAHSGGYNITIRNSDIVHISATGGGLILLDNVNVYTDARQAIIRFRDDYGSTWWGDVVMKNVTLRSSVGRGHDYLDLFHGEWNNHYFGFKCQLPTKVTLENLKIVKYEIKNPRLNARKIVEIDEVEVGVNTIPLRFMSHYLDMFTDVDVADPDFVMPEKYKNDLRFCECEVFNDTDGDGRCDNRIPSKINIGNTIICWGTKEKPDHSKNINPYAPPELIEFVNCGDLEFIFPPTPQFEGRMKVVKK